MCGITAIWGEENPEAIRVMMDSMIHRGPDAEGVFPFYKGKGMLGHRRLSIMDPEGGDQPILNEKKTRAVVANGEIYNFPELLPLLSKKYTFRTTSDSEAILHLYDEYGTGVVKYLDGMFAFVIADEDNIVAARDPIGIKPLYYGYNENGSMVYSSELKSISLCCQDVHEFPPGTLYHNKQGFVNFYSVPDIVPEEMSEEEAIQLVQERLEKAVVKRLMSDVPLGAFLSGGLDSSLICAIARQHVDELHTFSVGVEGSRDIEAARLVSRHLDTIHHEYLFTIGEILEILPNIIYALESYDQDLVRSAIPCYFTSRLAAEYVKVILTGEGADELFAGYTYYKDISNGDFLHSELRRSVESLHNINLQRVDRITMAHSLEGRVPFLDLNMIALGQRMPTELKLKGDPPVEKWILRKAFEDLLPHEIVWRVKEQFDEGSGSADALDEALSKTMTAAEAHEYASKYPGVHLRSPEECYYHKVFMDIFKKPEPVLKNVGRWTDRPEEIAC